MSQKNVDSTSPIDLSKLQLSGANTKINNPTPSGSAIDSIDPTDAQGTDEYDDDPLPPPSRMTENPTFATPSVSFLPEEVWDKVYKPAEDTYLMLDALESDSTVLRRIENRPTVAVEVGTGNGTIITFLRNLLESKDEDINNDMRGSTFYMALDLNETAIRDAARPVFTSAENQPSATTKKDTKLTSKSDTRSKNKNDFILSDLFSGFNLRRQLIDMIVFNPPYVETPLEEISHPDIIFKSWAGGPRGRIILDKFLNQLPTLLNSKKFLIYLVLTPENLPDDVSSIIKKQFSDADGEVLTDIVLKQKPGYENLMILRASKNITF